MPFDKQILCVAENDAVRQTKKMVLESAGFGVVGIGSVREAEYVLSRSRFDLVILGRSVKEVNKRAIADLVRLKAPQTPILEMCNVSPDVPGADHVMRSHDPNELAEYAVEILNVKK
jgi:DNA-binding NtrC family response regulator